MGPRFKMIEGEVLELEITNLLKATKSIEIHSDTALLPLHPQVDDLQTVLAYSAEEDEFYINIDYRDRYAEHRTLQLQIIESVFCDISKLTHQMQIEALNEFCEQFDLQVIATYDEIGVDLYLSLSKNKVPTQILCSKETAFTLFEKTLSQRELDTLISQLLVFINENGIDSFIASLSHDGVSVTRLRYADDHSFLNNLSSDAYTLIKDIIFSY